MAIARPIMKEKCIVGKKWLLALVRSIGFFGKQKYYGTLVV